ncbi:MAG: transcriptional regulator [Anaerolineae bacterium]
MTEGDVALTPLPQADGGTKPRPAILLRQMPPFSDWLVCGVSTQLHQEVVDFDDVIDVSHSDFGESGLKAPSLIRLGFLAVLPSEALLGVLGSISPERHGRLLQRLGAFLQASRSA